MNIYYDVEDNHYRTYPDGDIATIDQMRELVENKNLSIAKLQQENKKLNGAIQTYDILLKANVEENKQQKEVIDKTINAIDLVIELIKQQPTEDDRWILDRLNGFKIILEDKEVSE